jgi:hypothetical protein
VTKQAAIPMTEGEFQSLLAQLEDAIAAPGSWFTRPEQPMSPEEIRSFFAELENPVPEPEGPRAKWQAVVEPVVQGLRDHGVDAQLLTWIDLCLSAMLILVDPDERYTIAAGLIEFELGLYTVRDEMVLRPMRIRFVLVVLHKAV